jgi:putative nucleotidyltransferase with HDIG domain
VTKKTDPNYGKGEATVAEGDSLAPYIRQIKTRVKEAIVAENFEIPLLPHVATQVLQLANNPNAGFSDIEKLLKQDQILTTHLIKIANSAYYRGISEVVSLRDAMSRIGLKTLKDVVFSLSLHSKVFRIKSYEGVLKEVWKHSVACAGISQILAQYAGLNAENAFVAGLVHDIGKPVLVQVVSTWEQELLKSKTSPADPAKVHRIFEDVLLPSVFEDSHTQVGALVAAKWKLPQEIFESIRWHHRPQESQKDLKMIQLIYLANKLCHHFGYGHEEDPIMLKMEPSFALLNIGEAKIEKIGTDLPKVIDLLIEAMAV